MTNWKSILTLLTRRCCCTCLFPLKSSDSTNISYMAPHPPVCKFKERAKWLNAVIIFHIVFSFSNHCFEKIPQSHYAQFLILLVCFLFFFTSGQLSFDGREGRGFLGSHSFRGKWRVDQPKFFQLPSSLPQQKIMTDFPSLCSLFMKPSHIPTWDVLDSNLWSTEILF